MTAGPTDLRRRLVELDDAPPEAPAEDRNLTRELRMRVLDQAGSRVPRNLPDTEREALLRQLVDEVIEAQRLVLTPLERRTLVRQIISDTLGYGPLDPLMADDERDARSCATAPTTSAWSAPGVIERTDLAFSDDGRPATGHQPHRPRRRPPRRRVVADGRRPHARRLADERRRCRRSPCTAPGPHDPAVPRRARSRPRPGRHRAPTPRTSWPSCGPCVRASSTSSCRAAPAPARPPPSTCSRSFIGRRERVITIEDSAELQLQQPHVIPLETRPPNTEGEGQVDHPRPARATPCGCGPTG